MSAPVVEVLGVGMNVLDLERSTAFYRDALGFTAVGDDLYGTAWPIAGSGRGMRLQLGRQQCELTECDPPGLPYPPDSNAADLWFQHFAVVTNDMHAAYGRAIDHGATPITRGGPQTLPPSTGGVTCFKFRDPDGHPLELIEFPSGVGDPVWQQPSGQPTIGIDHSALSVADAERSLEFYRTLGLIEGRSQINSGLAQDQLDGLSSVIVEVIELGVDTTTTPHLELLCYRHPRGRPRDATDAPNALANSRLVLRVDGLHRLIRQLAERGFSVSDMGPIGHLPHTARLRDPDGHALHLIETVEDEAGLTPRIIGAMEL